MPTLDTDLADKYAEKFAELKAMVDADDFPTEDDVNNAFAAAIEEAIKVILKEIEPETLDMSNLQVSVSGVGFFGTAPQSKPTITGVTDSEKLASLITALQNLGLVN